MILAISDITREVDKAFYIIGGICLVMLVGVTLAMLTFAVKYNRRRTKTTRQISGNFWLEATWITLPTILVLYMFYVGYVGFKMMRDVPEGAKVVKVIGQQWFWTFIYPDEGVSSDRLFLPVNQPVKLELTAPLGDVVHSFYLPAFRVKEDAVPGMETYLWIQPEKEGTYNIFCAEFCGKDHARMISELVVVSPHEYEKWIQDRIADINKPVVMEQALDSESEEIVNRDDESLYKTYCVSCHGSKGHGGLVEGARDFTQLDQWQQGTRLTDIFRTITTGVEGTPMRSFKHLSAWDRFALVHKVASFYEGPDRSADTAEQIEQLRADYDLDKPWVPKKKVSIEQAMQAIAEEAKNQEK
jgi:cytochrome c oxidase subunit II